MRTYDGVRRPAGHLRPDDEVADLGDLKFDDDIDSPRVIDSMRIFDRVEYNDERSGASHADEERDERKKRKGR